VDDRHAEAILSFESPSGFPERSFGTVDDLLLGADVGLGGVAYLQVVSFSVDGKQYIAVSTGLGGGSPRQVPTTIAPDVHYPASGHGLYVFALPDPT